LGNGPTNRAISVWGAIVPSNVSENVRQLPSVDYCPPAKELTPTPTFHSVSITELVWKLRCDGYRLKGRLRPSTQDYYHGFAYFPAKSRGYRFAYRSRCLRVARSSGHRAVRRSIPQEHRNDFSPLTGLDLEVGTTTPSQTQHKPPPDNHHNRLQSNAPRLAHLPFRMRPRAGRGLAAVAGRLLQATGTRASSVLAMSWRHRCARARRPGELVTRLTLASLTRSAQGGPLAGPV